jgi:hypothetical protein
MTATLLEGLAERNGGAGWDYTCGTRPPILGDFYQLSYHAGRQDKPAYTTLVSRDYTLPM